LETRRENIHEPLLLFLSLWHCLGVRIYWDFSLGQAMTVPHITGQEKQRERGDDRLKKQEGEEKEKNIS